MDTTKAQELINKFLEGTLSSEERAILDDWYLSFSKFEEPSISNEDLQHRKVAILNAIDKQYHKEARKIKLWPRLLGVAAAVTAIAFGIWFYTGWAGLNGKTQIVSQHDIAPGRNVATLTLANGKVINLSDAKTGVVIGDEKLIYNDGSLVQKNAGAGGKDSARIAEQLVASTPKGGTYIVTLPDGTKVWLNAASSLKFPSHFANSLERRVELSGEAYFEVFKNHKQPFIVESEGQQVEVLGTHFNINSYPDESTTKTTLLEGSVRIAFFSPQARFAMQRSRNVVVPDGEQGSVTLKPNQQAILNSSNRMDVVSVDAEAVIGWKNGDFVFGGADLKSVMREIMRWYGVTVEYDISVPADIKLDGWVSRSSNLSVVLRRIESIGNVHFKLEGRRVTVAK